MLTDLQRIEHMIETVDSLLRFSANISAEEYAVSRLIRFPPAVLVR